MLENIGKATNKNPLIYASPKNFDQLGRWMWPRYGSQERGFLLLLFIKEALAYPTLIPVKMANNTITRHSSTMIDTAQRSAR